MTENKALISLAFAAIAPVVFVAFVLLETIHSGNSSPPAVAECPVAQKPNPTARELMEQWFREYPVSAPEHIKPHVSTPHHSPRKPHKQRPDPNQPETARLNSLQFEGIGQAKADIPPSSGR
jgi:hypothetical protein